MKKIMSAILAALLLCAALATPAMAAEAQYANTQDFLSALDEVGIAYRVAGIEENGTEKMGITFVLEDCDRNITINYFFTWDNEWVQMYVWNVIEYDPAKLADVLTVLNDINNEYVFVKLCADTTDNTVTAKMALVVRPGAAVGDIVLEGTDIMISIMNEVYPTLAALAK